MPSLLTSDEVRIYLQDYPQVNLLLDTEEFSPAYINLCITLAVDEFNNMTPRGSYTTENFPSKSVLLQGTCFFIFQGRAAVAARNQMSYSDGGLQIPIEERYELYRTLAMDFGSLFKENAAKLKASLNMESGWGSVSSDEAWFPIW